MWHQLANQDIYIMKVPDSEEREKERGAGRERKEDREKLSEEIMAKNFPSLMKDLNLQI